MLRCSTASTEEEEQDHGRLNISREIPTLRELPLGGSVRVKVPPTQGINHLPKIAPLILFLHWSSRQTLLLTLFLSNGMQTSKHAAA